MKLSASLNAENSEIVSPIEQAKNITLETITDVLRPTVQKNSFMHLQYVYRLKKLHALNENCSDVAAYLGAVETTLSVKTLVKLME